MTANELTQYTLKVLKLSGFEVWRNNAIPVRGRAFIGRKGVPDIIGYHVVTGQFIGVEIKVGSDKLRKEQKEFLDHLNHCKGFGWIVKSVEDLDKIQKALLPKNTFYVTANGDRFSGAATSEQP